MDGNNHASTDAADAARFRFLCARPDWRFIEEICLSLTFDTSDEFLRKLRAAIDERMAKPQHPFGDLAGALADGKPIPQGYQAVPIKGLVKLAWLLDTDWHEDKLPGVIARARNELRAMRLGSAVAGVATPGLPWMTSPETFAQRLRDAGWRLGDDGDGLAKVWKALANHSGVDSSRAPNFDAVRDKRMSELTPEQKDDAKELWLRDNIGWMTHYYKEHVEFLLKRLDAARGVALDRVPCKVCNGRGWETPGIKCKACDGGYVPAGVVASEPLRVAVPCSACGLMATPGGPCQRKRGHDRPQGCIAGVAADRKEQSKGGA